MSIHVYGIPTCSTCKRALQWLDHQGLSYSFINTKDTPPSEDQIAAWVTKLGNKPLRNTSGQSYRSLGAVKESWTDAEWIAAYRADAMLLKRPLFVVDGQAVGVGFKENNMEALSRALNALEAS